jgi:hypothetical protein
MALISKKWKAKDVEMVVAKSEVLYSHLPGETEENKKRGGESCVSWLRFKPDISKIQSEALLDEPT